MKSKSKAMGRPPAATDAEGNPEKTSEYPKLTVSIRPAIRAKLDAVTTLERKPAWRVVEEGIGLYVDRMAPADRRMVEAMARRAAEKQGA